MAGLNHQACGVLDLASAARCPDRALLSKHSNQNEKPDLGQESDAHDRDRKEHVARRERVHECLAPSEAPGVNHSGEKMFRFQTQTARDASGAGIRRGLRRSSANGMVRFGSISADLTVGRSLPVYPQLRTYRCTALTDVMCHKETHALQQTGRRRGRVALTARRREFSAIRLILMKPDLFMVAHSLTCVDYNFPALAK